MQRLVRGFKFGLSALLAIAVCHFGMGRLGLNPPIARPALPSTDDQFLAHYSRFGLDFIVLRHNLFGAADSIIQADVICSSSSKGLFGYDAAYLSQRLSRPGHPVRVYNLSFPFGEGFAYPIEVIKALDLHDKILLADLTDNTSIFGLTPMGVEAMRTTSKLDGYKLVVERSMMFWRDWLLTGIVPRLEFDRQLGFVARPQFMFDPVYRSRTTGDCTNMVSGEGERPIRYPKAVHYPFEFHYSELEQPFFEECRRRNIRIVFTSIPYDGYDPEYGARVAQKLGLPHAAVDPNGIRLSPDGIHMRSMGRQTFSERLADRLLSPGIDIQQRIAEVHRNPRGGTPTDLAERPAGDGRLK